MTSIWESLAGLAAAESERTARAETKPSRTAKAKFRSSLAWRRARYAALAANAQRNGGTARCELCGAAAAPGKPLHVDHIEAVSKNRARRFDKENLQVMCEDCNIGKLNGPAADFRPTELATK